MKICMIGCGSFARLCHGPAQQGAAASRPDLVLAGCCDSDPAKARAYQDSFGFRSPYAEPSSMLQKEKPDAVILAVPPPATCGAAAAVLRLGIPVLLEKPPGLRPSELETLIAAASQARAGAQVGFNRRYMPVMRAAKSFLSTFREMGKGARITYEMTRQERWDADFSTTAVHAVDAALFLAGSPFRTARMSYESHRRGSLAASDVTLSALCASGAQVSVNIRPVSTRTADSATVDAGGDSLRLTIPVSPQTEGDGTAEHWRGGSQVSSFSDKSSGAVERMGVLGETEAFLDAVRGGGPFRPSLEDCRQPVFLMDAMRDRKTGPFEFAAG